MKITKVTLTGADDSIKPEGLFELSAKYPFVEWGILLSRNSVGSKRFPSLKWMKELEGLDRTFYDMEVQFSGHLCGAYVREILIGNTKVIDELDEIWSMFQRIQINTHGIPHEYNSGEITKVFSVYNEKEIIFQYDEVNADILMSVANSINCSTLFDLSHGAGVLPDEWPLPIPNIKCGYAGGLSPENLESQIKLIESKIKDAEIWIDMETHLRSNNDKLFDLKKCETVLEIASQLINQSTPESTSSQHTK